MKIPRDTIAHDLALAALIGGNAFARVAMHPALTDISDSAERGKVLNRAWRRYGTVNSLALATLLAERLPERLHRDSRSSNGKADGLDVAKDAVFGAVVVSGVASAASGIGFAQQAPDGAVPMTSGHDTAPETPRRAARLKRAVNALGAANLVASIALLAVDRLAQANAGAAAPRRTVLRRLRGAR